MNATKTNEKSDADLMNNQQAKREADQAQANRDELTERIAQAIHHDGKIEPLKGLHFNRISSPAEPCHSVSIPAFCVIAQGSKEVLLGSDRYQYDPMRYLLATAELPVISQILEASKEKPYLSLMWSGCEKLLGRLLVQYDRRQVISFAQYNLLGWCFPSALMQHILADLEQLCLDMGHLQSKRDWRVQALQQMGYQLHAPMGTEVLFTAVTQPNP